jgi:hypothetical protein
LYVVGQNSKQDRRLVFSFLSDVHNNDGCQEQHC